jgi:hypothetical protein
MVQNKEMDGPPAGSLFSAYDPGSVPKRSVASGQRRS